MRVFISWSGPRSRAAAEALRDWFGTYYESFDPFMSANDIAAGSRWILEIADQLAETDFGIICVTPENMEKPWLQFEAGALSKSMEVARVVPLLIGMQSQDLPSANPLSHFQAKRLIESEMLDVVQEISRVGESRRTEQQIATAFATNWPQLRDVIEAIPEPADTPPVSERTSDQILEELVDSVRRIDSRTARIARKIATRQFAPPDPTNITLDYPSIGDDTGKLVYAVPEGRLIIQGDRLVRVGQTPKTWFRTSLGTSENSNSDTEADADNSSEENS